MRKPGLLVLMNSGQGKSKLKQVSRQAGVVISSDSDEDERSSGQIRRRGGAGSDERAVYSAAGGQEVIVFKGDITGLDVDVIVNAANKDLFHSGGLAKVLVKKGGTSIQDECDQFTSYKGQLTEGECYCFNPGKLNCQMIVHAVGPVWRSGSNHEEETLQMCVETGIVQTEKNNHSNIAIPALFTGIFGYPPNMATRAIVKAVRDYFKRNKYSNVQTVYLCDVSENSVDLFVKAGDKIFDQAKEGKRKSGGRQSGDKKLNISRHDLKLIGAQTQVERVIMTSVTFVIYARDKHAAQNAIKLLEQSIESECDEKTICSKIIKEFNADQKSEVKNLEASGKIQVSIDTTKSEIKIRGLKQHISEAFDDVHNIIRDAEMATQTKQNAKLVTDMVQWYYMDEDKGKKKLEEYPSEVNLILELALKEQKTQATFSDTNGNKYIVDLNAYEEYPADDINDKVQVLRKSKLVDQAFEPPLTWVPMDEKENLKVVQLQPKDQEYKDVTSKFLSTAGANVEFVKVERIQNKVLYQQFIAKKKSMDDINPKTVQNERPLWHGFSVDVLDSICRYGFNRSYCGKNATALGAGVYFAVNVNYSINDTYSRPDSHGHKRMFLCRVLTGEYCPGDSTMKTPTAKKSGGRSYILYDTVTNDVNNPIMFVIFHDSQAFPEYLVTFKKK